MIGSRDLETGGGADEPVPPKVDPFIADKIQTNHVIRPAIPTDASRSDSKLSRSSKKSYTKASRKKTISL